MTADAAILLMKKTNGYFLEKHENCIKVSTEEWYNSLAHIKSNHGMCVCDSDQTFHGRRSTAPETSAAAGSQWHVTIYGGTIQNCAAAMLSLSTCYVKS